jgi:amidohydrolase
MPDTPQSVDPFLLHQFAVETEQRARILPASVSAATGAREELLSAIGQAVKELSAELVEASHDLAEHPEVAFEEHRSSAAMADLVESHQISVTRGAYGLDTALRAEFGDPGQATVAILSEYDALPGIGHGCGHNIIATAGVGAFLALAAVADQLPGRVVWMGTPAEEGGSGKELMARAGAFDDVDAAVMVHPFGYNLGESIFLGRRQLRATFTGIASHASAQPFMGRNALDAVNLTYTGVALHRQQMPPTDRIHGVITDGGQRPNVIPERAEILFYLRSEYPESLKILSQRLDDIARGAALMTGCAVELTWDEAPPYLPLRTNQPLAAAWNRRFGDRGHDMLGPGVVPATFAGSTDFGNVSYRVPGLHAMIKIGPSDLSLHTREFAAAAVSAEADEVLLDSAYGLAAVVADYLSDDALRTEVTASFDAAGGALDVPSYFS